MENYKSSNTPTNGLPLGQTSIHIISEAIIIGGLSVYVHKKISDLESTIEDLKQQIAMQNNQLRYLLGSNLSTNRECAGTTPLRIRPSDLKPPSLFVPSSSGRGLPSHQTQTTLQSNLELESDEWFKSSSNKEMECKGGVCTLVRGKKLSDKNSQEERKVVISKISKQIEFDRENNDFDQSSKVNTFTKFSPDPVLKSVTPKPSTSVTTENEDTLVANDELNNILNEIDNE